MSQSLTDFYLNWNIIHNIHTRSKCVYLREPTFSSKALRRNLEVDVCKDVSGDFERILVALLQGKREGSVDDAQVKHDAEALYRGGEA